ncbi:MAG TPA: Uma2 family endonuclease [Blastocatellia bacterium]|nr:Uma2 family endonuclease [Blastocatellia bacterium]
MRNRVKYDLFETVEDHNLGRVLGSDFVMRLGEDRFTPDIIYVHLERLGRLREYYLDGPADIVVEVPAPGHLSSLRGS